MKQFITEDCGHAGPIIEACDFEHAVMEADKAGVQVVGELMLTIQSATMSPQRADAIAKALAESIQI